MEKKIEKRVVNQVYNLLNGARLGKMTGGEKLSVVKLLRVLKPVAVEFDEARNDIVEKMKPEGYDERLRKAIAFERKEETEMTLEEYHKFLKELNEYNQLVGKAVDELGNEVMTLETAALTEEALEHLFDNNDWTTEQVMAVADFANEE